MVDARCGHHPATWDRARGWALVLATAMLGDPAMAAVAGHTLEQVLLD